MGAGVAAVAEQTEGEQVEQAADAVEVEPAVGVADGDGKGVGDAGVREAARV